MVSKELSTFLVVNDDWLLDQVAALGVAQIRVFRTQQAEGTLNALSFTVSRLPRRENISIVTTLAFDDTCVQCQCFRLRDLTQRASDLLNVVVLVAQFIVADVLPRLCFRLLAGFAICLDSLRLKFARATRVDDCSFLLCEGDVLDGCRVEALQSDDQLASQETFGIFDSHILQLDFAISGLNTATLHETGHIDKGHVLHLRGNFHVAKRTHVDGSASTLLGNCICEGAASH
mmetsp:Transcript_23991/g.52217  ORF Transcript_23991/g.52217 Transcript_23991/m.52217 type:complete len:232 (-) Transcript_23991:2333-3028(-)